MKIIRCSIRSSWIVYGEITKKWRGWLKEDRFQSFHKSKRSSSSSLTRSELLFWFEY